MEIKDLTVFNDKGYKPYTEGISGPIRLKVDEARVLNGIGTEVDVDPRSILRAAIMLVDRLFSIEKDQFYSEVTRNRKLEMDKSVSAYKDSIHRREAAKRARTAPETLPEGFFDKFSEGMYYETNEDQKKRTRMLIKYHCKTSAKRLGMDWRLTPDYKKFLRCVRRNETPHKIFAQLSDGSVKLVGTFRHVTFKNLVLV